jgi:uncharacterized DUF497 family protein
LPEGKEQAVKPIRCHAENLARHGVDEAEVREVFAGRYLRLRNPSGGARTYLAVGRTYGGRVLELAYEDQGTHWWVFHAMPARPRLVRVYRKRRKQHGIG